MEIRSHFPSLSQKKSAELLQALRIHLDSFSIVFNSQSIECTHTGYHVPFLWYIHLWQV